MDHPTHSFRLFPTSTRRHGDVVQVVTARQKNPKHAALFNGPALPTRHQLYCDVPFSVNFLPKKSLAT
ncbi:MAG: hypothetical protein ABIZ81_05990 [Opitutaceae bacterium]